MNLGGDAKRGVNVYEERKSATRVCVFLNYFLKDRQQGKSDDPWGDFPFFLEREREEDEWGQWRDGWGAGGD